MTRTRDTYEHSGAFVLRTPLLPVGTLDDLAAAPDVATLAERLRAFVADPAVREAIFLASPSLDERLDRWLSGEDTDDAEVVRPLLSYVTRMAGRATPFGLFAGCAVGEIGRETHLAIAPPKEATRHTRLDFGFLAKVVAALGADPAVQPFLTLVPNSSLYRAGARLRMAEARVDERGVRYHRVTFEEDAALTETLDRARGGARLGDLAAALVEGDITREEAEEYVGEMVSAQLLVSELGPVVTGPEPVPGMVATLSRQEETAAYAAALDAADKTLAALDANGVGNPTRAYRDLAESLRSIDPDLRIDRLFQVDLGRPGAGLSLGDDVMDELYRAVDLLHRISPKGTNEELTKFREALTDRYEQREVPLAEALDEEIGVGYGPPPALAAEGAPLLQGVLGVGRAGGGQPFTSYDARLLRILATALADGRHAYELTNDDIEALTNDDPLALPDALSVSAVVARTDDGPRVLIDGVVGPSGARILGRFCHLDPEIEALVRRHVEAEERVRPDLVFAEVVHLPEGRVGNILARPVLREHEIPFLAVSGIGEEGRLPIDDLMVSVVGDRIVLRSKRLDREVVPRITNAHNHHTGALAVYRFLGALQYQGVAGSVGWSWGSLANAPFLPRVTHRRLVLAPAVWNVAYDELGDVRKAKTPEQRYAAVQALRERRGLPRRLVVSVGDNDLPVDLDGAGGCELLAHEARRGGLKLVELFPAPEELPVTSPEGVYAHEVVVPLVRKAPVAPPFQRVRREETGVEAVFPPGSEWLTAKIYTGKATGDAVLREAVTPLVGSVLRDGLADGWFFIRYADPEQHLRLRFHGDARTIAGEVLPRLREAVAPLLDDGRVWRVQLDTYRREVARYGGPQGVLAAERVFRADSEAVLAVLAAAEGDEGLDVRWRMAVCGVDGILADGGLDVAARREAVRRWRDGLVTEHGGTGDNAKQQAGKLFRKERQSLAALLDGQPSDPRTAAGLAALARRSEVARPLLAGIPQDILGSHCHMHVNRLLRAAQRTQELVVYDLLDRLYAARIGRAKASG
ncbi:MAG TPA: lantibiotic dehydratase [Mycobacteriales bacterium]|nr:lantibiotic dehydratase [Mycobacteriales bacterium]